jgi:hypothetical protein
MVLGVLVHQWAEIESTIVYNAQHCDEVAEDQGLILWIACFVHQQRKQRVEDIAPLLDNFDLRNKDELSQQV